MKNSLLLFIALLSSCTSIHKVHLTADSGFAAPALKSCKTDLRYLNQVAGWQGAWPTQWHRIANTKSHVTSTTLAKWSQVPQALTALKKKLANGIINKETAPQIIVSRIYQQVHDLAIELNEQQSKYSFEAPVNDSSHRWNFLIKNKITPAVVDFETFLRDSYLPAARSAPGLTEIDQGKKCFTDAVTWWTSLNPTQNEIEETGKRILKETRIALATTGNKGETADDILKRLRLSVKNNNTTSDQLITLSENAIIRAQKKALTKFTKNTLKEIVIKPMPLHMQASFPAGRYGRAEEGLPASYIINPSRPNERRLMAEVITFHETIPGHHPWISYPRTTPSSSKHVAGFSGISEGWAIYAEYLADEMKLYSSTFDRQGMITKHLWAASRLIVEPGLHLRGWSREKAIQFMLKNTLLSRTEIELEVDRYIAMPGQSLSYMLGADLFLSERKRAQDILGIHFDIKAFHDVIIEPGVRPLHKVRNDIRSWVSKQIKQSKT